MHKIKIYNLKGETNSDKTLDSSVFEAKENGVLVAQAVRTERANLRQSIAHTKDRGEVSGGGKKPWKQKGTGNARAGSSRSPLWSGGGITFGPRSARNFSLRMPQKMKQQALKNVLSQKAAENKIVVVKDFDLKEISTKNLVSILEKLPIETGKILLILAQINPTLELSAANLRYIKIIKVENINVLDIAGYEYLLATEEALVKIEQILGAK